MTLDTVKTHVTQVLGKPGPKAPANPRSKRPCLRGWATLWQHPAAPPRLTDTEGSTDMTEPITRHQDSEDRLFGLAE